jgi:hypothetical protein
MRGQVQIPRSRLTLVLVSEEHDGGKSAGDPCPPYSLLARVPPTKENVMNRMALGQRCLLGVAIVLNVLAAGWTPVGSHVAVHGRRPKSLDYLAFSFLHRAPLRPARASFQPLACYILKSDMSRGCSALALTLALTCIVHGQDRSSLDRVVAIRIPTSAPRCGMERILTQLAQQTKILVGLEETPECILSPSPSPSHVEDASNVTVRQVLDRVVMVVPGYRWQEIDGVAVVRPTEAWEDPADPLNLPVEAIRVQDVHVSVILAKLLRLTSLHVNRSPRLISKPVTARFAGGTLLAALNATIRSHEEASWILGLIAHPDGDRGPSVAVTFIAFDASAISVSTPLTRLRTSR